MTRDGHLVLITQNVVDRTTNGTGKVKDLTLNEIKSLDAGYTWTIESAPHTYPPEAINGGYTKLEKMTSGVYPYRGKGIRIPTVKEVFQALPDIRINIELKQKMPSIAAALCEVIMSFERSEMTMVTSFDHISLTEFRQKCPDVATTATKKEVKTLITLNKLFLSELYSPDEDALQLPIRTPSMELLTSQFVEKAHERGIPVYAWTINDKELMRNLVDMGVDGIITDYPDRLLDVLYQN
jgi:glycerophosphoryl diester phosphodiesterase